ncbi:MAG: hypothetical protein ACLFUB_03525 [Cyclobacteriaceae bacterium]
MYLRQLLICLLITTTVAQVSAQSGSTPYSSQGLGYLQGSQLVHNSGMGGIGLASGTSFHINNMNPAQLYRNSLTSFDFAFNFEYKDMMRNGETASIMDGGLAYGVFAFPVINNRWTSSVGISPFSMVDYERESIQEVNGSEENALLTRTGSGGLSQVYFSNGFRVAKGLGLGLKLGYLFGAINSENQLIPLGIQDVSLVTSYNNNIYYRGLLIEPGLHYSLKTADNTSLNVGVVFQPEMQINATRLVTYESRNPAQVDAVSRDTIVNNMEGSATLPQKLGVGLAFEKLYKYKVGVDFTNQQWSEFGSYQAESDNGLASNEGMQNAYLLAVGGEIIPDINSVDSYLKRVAYRVGFQYSMLPFQVNDTKISELAVTLGFSLPMSNVSSLNLSLQAGSRGTTSNELIRENFFRAQLGISFNDRWFMRRRFD